ncbi:MAG: sulfatase-like hydrolase/transferase [Verrucomicrobiales bacterium]
MKRIALLAAASLASIASFAGAADQPNVLFIAVDDLRPEIGSFGAAGMQTPNLDRLATMGIRFERAYCMVPTCGASRAALMTSIRPARDRFVTHLTRASEDAPGKLPLHSLFKNNGYTTISLGKIFHHMDDHNDGWSEKPWRPNAAAYATQEAKKNQKSDPRGRAGHARRVRPAENQTWEDAEK